ncbi:MAG: UvrD-helicase domain-containing protein [Deltaproteobacteria bacterium]|nr:UvrD-helicase domain-containing protein [Deltaproteobacteria bacterium]
MRKPEDEKFRQIIVKNLDNSILVEAGAGSGKTTSLIERMLALIATGRCTVDKMAAVTFTRKAAAELKGKFQIALEGVFAKEKNKEKQSRFQNALATLELLFAGTIHSFCARLLRERPIEARLDPDFEELDEIETVLLRDRCWSEYLEGLQAEGAYVLEKVTDLGLDPIKLIDTYHKAALYPEVEIARKKLKRPEFGKEKKLLKKYLEQSWKSLPKEASEKGWDGLQRILRQAWLRSFYFNPDKDQDFIKILNGLDKSGGIVQNRWPTKEIAKEQKAEFDIFKDEIISPCLKKWQKYCHYFIMELVVPAVTHFKEVREKSSLMDYQDLLLRSAELLRNNSEVRKYFQNRFTHILVDEFQDTDPIQAEVMLYLTGENLEETAWQKTRIKPGSLFIVGDPKQSIYRFRRADIDIYNEMKRIVKNSGGLIVPLTANFRSLPAVCDWINPIFKSKFPEKASQYQPGFEPLVPFKKMKNPGVKRITIGKVPGNRSKEIARQDAERIAAWIDWALDGNFKILRTKEETKERQSEVAGPGDCMILLRYKAHLSMYAKALEERGIPYEISGGGAFNESEEIKHLLNLLAAVSEPEDQVALVSTLRGPFFGVSDDLLYRFRKKGGLFNYFAPADKCSDEEACVRIGDIFGKINKYHYWARNKPPAAALSMILNHLGIIPLALTRKMGESRAGNLMKALELSLGDSSGSQTSFYDMVERLGEFYNDIDVEGMSIEPGKKDAVRIMNLHKAKGLEATVVFLAEPSKDISHPPGLHISRFEKKAAGYFIASAQTGEYTREIAGIPPDWEKYEALEFEYQKAEEERLLYVATTRARQLLVVSRYPEKPTKGAWKDLNRYLYEVEELETEKMAVTAVDEGNIIPEDFEVGKTKINERISKSKMHSYITESVTAASKASVKETPFSEDTGQGMSWGRIFHKMIEAVTKDASVDFDLMAENLLKEEERPVSEKDLIIKTIKAVMSSKLWRRMKKSENALVEVPFSLKVDEAGTTKIVSGVIDLVFKEPEGWVIADYKTDKVDENLNGLVNYYRPQVELYSKFWEEMTGEKVKESGLYFVDTNEWVNVLG